MIGAGYVGLTTAACFASIGHTVTCADIDADRIDALNDGLVPIVEAGLVELVRAGLDTGRLRFVVGAAAAVHDCEFAYLCVPTPQSPDGSADLSYIRSAAAEIGPLLPSEAIVVNKSTVPVGSTRVVEEVLGRDDVRVVSNPEFLREGSAVHDFLNPDRVVIGSDDQAAAFRVASLFDPLRAQLLITDPASAETIKYASNAFLAAKVSFVNAIANVCEAVGADVRDVLMGMSYDKRIGSEFMRPGPGFGGSCFLGDDTVLCRRGGATRLLSFAELSTEVDRVGADGWEVLAWRPGEPTAEFLAAVVFTRRDYRGDVVTVTTKMGRRITVTEDHPLVVADGIDAGSPRRLLARDVAVGDWMPIAQNGPQVAEPRGALSLLDAAAAAGIPDEKVILWASDGTRADLRVRSAGLPAVRRYEVNRLGALRLHEARQIGFVDPLARIGTVSNGTSTPVAVAVDDDFWRMVGLYLAEGWVTRDGARDRISWAFNLTKEPELVEFVADYWRRQGVKVTVREAATAMHVCISSRILAGVLTGVLDLGSNCYVKRIPDAAWDAPPAHKRALLRGLWDGDGSWSKIAGGPSVVFEYGTASARLADGMLRLLGDLGITARLRIARVAKSTVDTSWLVISGADQLENALWLFPEEERPEILSHIGAQAKRIKPTGYRRLSKNASWARVTSVARTPFEGPVYSLKVPEAGTVVTTGGLVVGQCFPKDTAALIRIAADAGYDFGLLRGVTEVNTEQFERVVAKVETAAGGALDGVTVAAWGLTFKARTDDLRMSPSLEVIGRLLARGARVRAHDPAIGAGSGHRSLEGIDVCADPYAPCEGAAVLVVLTEWDDFRRVDLSKVAGLLQRPLRVVDARNLLDPAELRKHGFQYTGIGR
ncbi:MAG: UDPglucose 6-dehydrogenase [Actinomycetota bacterium]|nr:UDPglucose 6-dehydrogenase [Actinomycetota bacterium]